MKVKGRPKTMYTVVHFPAKNGGEYAISLVESKGATKNNVLAYTLYCFPAKKEGKKNRKVPKRPGNSQYLQKYLQISKILC